MGTDITDWFFSGSSSNYGRKMMKIVILLFAVLATINAAALQKAKAEDKPAAVKAEFPFGDKEKAEFPFGDKKKAEFPFGDKEKAEFLFPFGDKEKAEFPFGDKKKAEFPFGDKEKA